MLSARPSRCDRSTARPDALVCPSMSSGTGSSSPPPGHEQMACGFPRKARCPSGLAAVIALRAGRDDPRVHPQDVCDCPRAAARRSLNTPPRHRPRVPRQTQFPAGPSSPPCPTPAPSPIPSPSPSGPPSPSLPAKPEQNYDVHRIGNGQPIGRPPSTSRPVCPECVPVMKTIRYPGLSLAERAELLGNRAGWLLLAELQAAHRGT